MAISFEDSYLKAQFIAGDPSATTLVQLKQDINIGYKRFDAAISRYFTRKQKFANLITGQKYYQTPVDAIRVTEVSVTLNTGYEYPLEQVRSEHDWRLMNIVPNYASNLIQFYFVYGNDQIGLFPVPSQNVTNGIRFVYQPQDVDLTQDDYTTGTATITANGTAVTGIGTSWTTAMVGRQFQITDGSDGQWYEITAAGSSTSITLKTPYNGISVSGTTYKIAQVFIFPGEYDDVPVDYALSRYFEFRNNPNRATYHTLRYTNAVQDALRRYSSSSTSSVITDSDGYGLSPQNIWMWPPQPG